MDDNHFDADCDGVDRDFDAMRPRVWTTREGVEIYIKDMTDKHLVNSLRMLERNTEAGRQKAIAMGELFLTTLRGEQAQYSIEQELANLESGEIDTRDIFPVYDDLVEEAEKRGLEW
jgi:hypothetical protein